MRINKSFIALTSSDASVAWSNITGTPTTLSGYGITDGVPTSRTLTINGTTYDLSANRTFTIADTNIYNTDGTITADRTITIADKKLIYTSTNPTNYTFVNVPTGASSQTWPVTFVRDGVLNYSGTTNAFPSIKTDYYWYRNTGSNNVTTILNESYLNATYESTGVGSLYGNYLQVHRGFQNDTNTNTVSTIYGQFVRAGHGVSTTSNSTSSAISTNNVYAQYVEANNFTGSITSLNAGYFTYLVSSASNTRNSTVENVYGLRVFGRVGVASGPTGTVTNLYSIHLDTPSVLATGTVTNRWGVYAPDSAMRHSFVGDTIVGGTTAAGFKLDVVGTARISSTTTLTNLAGSGDRMVIASSTGVLSTQAIPSGVNIYNSDGSLTGSRTLTGTSNNLTFSFTSGGILAWSTTGLPFWAYNFSSNTSSIDTIIRVQKSSSGTVVNGVGAAIEYLLETDGNVSYRSNRLISKWSNVVNASRTSQFVITGVLSASESDLFTLSGDGGLKLNKYGVNAFTGTPAYSLAVDALGNVIETANTITTSGTYTPTLTNVANISSNTITLNTYSRNGAIVTVYGYLTLTPTASATTTTIAISLPIASNLASDSLVGVFNSTENDRFGGVYPDIANDRAELSFTSSSTTSRGIYYSFQYQII